MRWMLFCVGVLLLLPACSPDKGFGPSKEVSVDDYGAEWPLTVTSAVLGCEPGDIAMLTVDGHSYPLDTGMDANEVHPDLERIWAKDPQVGSTERRDLSPLVTDAMELCD